MLCIDGLTCEGFSSPTHEARSVLRRSESDVRSEVLLHVTQGAEPDLDGDAGHRASGHLSEHLFGLQHADPREVVLERHSNRAMEEAAEMILAHLNALGHRFQR